MSLRSPFDRLVLPVACVLVWAAHAALFLGWLPTENGTLGHDYAYFFPALLSGYFWFLGNGFAVPWFTPALCGGLPMYPNPESLYYSFPQLFTLMSDPLLAVRATFVTFSAVGVVGAVLLLRSSFGLSRSASFLGAALFLFNGYYAHRMLVGHLGFHSVMLVPLIAYAVLRPLPPQSSRDRVWRMVGDGLIAGLAVGYMIQSGNHDLVPTVLATGGVMLLAFMRGTPAVPAIVRAVGAFTLGVLLCASKLAAGFAYLGSFPRSGYPVPGAESLAGAVRLVIDALFLGASNELANLLVNTPFTLERHEFEYGLTVVPALLIAAAAVRWVVTRLRSAEGLRFPNGVPALALAALLILLCIPVVMNLDSPTLAGIIKQIPVLKNSSSFIRWIGVYVPIVVVGAALALDSFPNPRSRVVLAALGVVALIAINASTERSHYTNQPYQPGQLVDAMERVRAAGVPTPITRLGQVDVLNRNDFMAAGISPMACYETIFGYRLEWFPSNDLRPGPVGQRHGGGLNLLNPSCFVFPEANGCSAGSRFRTSDAERAERFVHYQGFGFARPARQSLADGVNLAALVGTAGLAVALAGRSVSRRRAERSVERGGGDG